MIIVVSFGNENVIEKTLHAVCPQLEEQDDLWIVDNGNGITNACEQKFSHFSINVFRSKENLGFCKGNNVGLELGHWHEFSFVLLLNPDLVLPAGWINSAIHRLQHCQSEKIGILSGPLLKYDFISDSPTGNIDSLGIAQTRFSGRWYDLKSGESYAEIEKTLPSEYDVDAICGALMLIPTSVINTVINNTQLLDERFFAYKEDIDLSIRIRNAGFRLTLVKALSAFHGRGWSPNRASVPFKLKSLSARNDLILNIKYCSPFIILSILKYIYVHTIEKIFFSLLASNRIFNSVKK